MVQNNKKSVLGFSRQKHKEILEETWRDWVSKLNSRLSFYYRLAAVYKRILASAIKFEIIRSLTQNVLGLNSSTNYAPLSRPYL